MIKVKCEYCKKELPIELTKNWQMQVLHFADDEIEFLTCEKCKELSPMKYLEKIESPAASDKGE